MEDSEIAKRLRESISRILRVMRNEVKQDEQLSITERSTLSIIGSKPRTTPTELARTERVTGQAMSQIIYKLVGLKLIEKIPSESDKRKVFLVATPKGKEFIELKRSNTNEWLTKSISEKCTEEEKEILLKSSEILARLGR